jgi:hypothetical protein
MSRLEFGLSLESRIFGGIDLSRELFRGFFVFDEFVPPEFGMRDPAF